MKWLFILLLLLNLIYLGWELDKQTVLTIVNTSRPFKVPATAKKLSLVSEINNESTNETDGATDVTNLDVEQPGLFTEYTVQQPYSDVSIEENFAVGLVTQMPDIVASDTAEMQSNESFLCFSYGPFTDQQQASELMTWFMEKDIRVKERTENNIGDQLFWIYLSPQESEEGAIQAVNELKQKGIKDYRLINTGDLKNAISLGLFSTQTSVNKRINELKSKGYQPIVVPYRNANKIYWLDVRIIRQEDIYAELFNSEPSRFNSVPVSCSEIALL